MQEADQIFLEYVVKALVDNPSRCGKPLIKKGPIMPPIWPMATTRENPFLAESGVVISDANAQKRATIKEP